MDIFKKLDVIRRLILIASFASLFFLIAGFLLLALATGASRSVWVILSFGLFIVSLVGIAIPVSRYKRLYGQNMLKSVLENAFENVTYEPDRALSADVIENTDMIMMGNSYESAEYRTGVYRGISFTMADVTLKNLMQSGKRRASVIYFSGSWMVFRFPKAFSAYLQVKEKSFLNAQKPRGAHPDMNRALVGEENFTRFFKVYAESTADAERFLTKELQDAITALNYELRGDLMFYFCGNTLHIALHGKRAKYEPPILGKLYRDEVEDVLLADCRAVSAFLDRILEFDNLFLDE